MSRFALTGARIFDGTSIVADAAVVIEDARIAAVVPASDLALSVRKVDLEGGLLAPGFIDAQVNGGGGTLFNEEPTADEPSAALPSPSPVRHDRPVADRDHRQRQKSSDPRSTRSPMPAARRSSRAFSASTSRARSSIRSGAAPTTANFIRAISGERHRMAHRARLRHRPRYRRPLDDVRLRRSPRLREPVSSSSLGHAEATAAEATAALERRCDGLHPSLQCHEPARRAQRRAWSAPPWPTVTAIAASSPMAIMSMRLP